MTLDDRMARARNDVAHALDSAPPLSFTEVQRAARRRRLAEATAAAVIVTAIATASVVALRDDDPTNKIRTTRPTTPAPTSSTSVAPTSSSAPPTTTTTAPAGTTTGIEPTGPAPDTFVGIRDDGALVRVHTADGTVANEIAREGRQGATPTGPNQTPANFIFRVAVGANGRVIYDDCCEPVSGDIFDPLRGSAPALEGMAGNSMFGAAPAISPNGRLLATYLAPNIEIRDLTTGHLVRRLEANKYEEKMFGLAIADDGRVAVETANGAAPASHALFVFGPSATTTDHFVFSGGWEYGSAVQPVFLPDGRMVYAERDEGGASGAPTQPTRLYVYAGGTDATVLPGEVPGGVIDLAVSATGRLLATGTDHVVRTFDGTTWHEVARGYSAAAW